MSRPAAEPARARRDVAEMDALASLPRPTVRRIAEAVAAEWDVAPADLLSARRGGLSVPRQAAMALARDLTGHSLPTIGRALRRDASTVHHGIAAHARRCAGDPALAARCAALATTLRQEA